MVIVPAMTMVVVTMGVVTMVVVLRQRRAAECDDKRRGGDDRPPERAHGAKSFHPVEASLLINATAARSSSSPSHGNAADEPTIRHECDPFIATLGVCAKSHSIVLAATCV
jgi:hypothetical protein